MAVLRPYFLNEITGKLTNFPVQKPGRAVIPWRNIEAKPPKFVYLWLIQFAVKLSTDVGGIYFVLGEEHLNRNH